ncbi:MAG: O-antigen ligase family protein [Gaiellaceae bacterium]
MNGYLSILAALVAIVILGIWFVRNERRRTPEKTVLFFLAFLIAEAVIYKSQSRIPAGLVHPVLGGDPNPGDDLIETAFSFRLLDILIPVALGARLLGSRGRGGSALPTFAWLGFLAWLGLAAIQGMLLGNSLDLLLFEGKALVYLGLLFVVLGADLRVMVMSRAFERLLLGAAAAAVLMTGANAAGIEFDLPIPIIPLDRFGVVGTDAASIFGALAVVTLVLAATRESGRLPLLGATVAFMAPALIAQQRAALLGLGVSIAFVCLLALAAPQRIRVTAAEGGLLVLALAFVVGTLALVGAGVQNKPFALPFVSSVEQTFGRGDKALSAESRVNQWNAAPLVIADRPWTGWGLGKTYLFYDPGPRDFVRTNLTHNIGLDLLLRTGVIGLGLFGAAFFASLAVGIRVWRRASDPLVAALALASAAIVAALISKGMVESLFEKYRLAAFLGLIVGIGLTTLSRELVRKREAHPVLEVTPA